MEEIAEAVSLSPDEADVVAQEAVKAVRTAEKKTDGKKALQKLFEIEATGGDDPSLSENIDSRLYGAPNKHP